jgi:DNA-binding beta-propeller fold protein YncE
MKKIHSYSWLGLIAVAAFLVGSASAQNELSNGRAALALQTPEALETAYQAFKNGLAISPRDAQLNFFYAATLLAREAHTDAFKQQFTSLNATIVNPSIYALEYSFPLGFANIFQPPNGVRTDGHLAYLNSKAAKIDEAISCLNQITDSNFSLTLSSAETSLLDTTVDYADVCLLRSGLRLARAALNLTNSYNVSGEYRKLYELYAAGNLTPQACLATFPQLFNLSATLAQRSDARAQIQLAYADWAKALAAIKNKRPASKGSVLGPNDNNGAATPFLFAFDSVPAAEEIGAQFNALVLSLSGQQTLPSTAKKYFALEGFKINLSRLVTSSSSLRSLAPTRFDRRFFRPSSWPDPTLGGIFPDASQDLMNDGGNFLYLIQPTIYEPYQFWLLVGSPANSGYFEQGEVRFNEINGIAVDPNGNIYVADEGNHVIRKISLDNKVSVAAGQKWTTWEERESLQQKYQGNTAYYPSILDSNVGPITADGNGTVYFASENKIFKISLDGKVLTFAGKSSWSKPKDGLGAQAAFYDISAITADKNGNIYACDANAIRKITQSAQVTTLAGKLGWDDSDGYVDGAGPVARFNDPTGIAVDDSGVVYIMDSGNGVIRKIQTNGITSTFVGDAKNGNYLDAKGTKVAAESSSRSCHGLQFVIFILPTILQSAKPSQTAQSSPLQENLAQSTATFAFVAKKVLLKELVKRQSSERTA